MKSEHLSIPNIDFAGEAGAGAQICSESQDCCDFSACEI